MYLNKSFDCRFGFVACKLARMMHPLFIVFFGTFVMMMINAMNTIFYYGIDKQVQQQSFKSTFLATKE